MGSLDRNSQLRWDKEHMTAVTCRVTKEKALRFKAACAILGTNQNAELLKTVNRIIEEAESNNTSGKED